ncbi:histone-like nucleoid-structuring protein Lsr2 [Nonomuraea sp. NPDC046802]|uniref:Lsr2 family DNA-binding protein n=1 Tax=Nonomuraea sp. NPDC046802 TaxID=3154919 RepID=UPI0033C00FC9
MTVIPVEHARALVLLTEGKTAKEAADATGQTLGRIVGLARQQGWTIHPSTQKATAPMEDDSVLRLPPDVVAIAASWTEHQPEDEHTDDDVDDGSVDELLEDARDCDDRRVQSALTKAETAIARLREVYEETAARIADERAAEAARAAALAEVAELKAKLALAEQKAAEVGAKLRKTPSKPKTSEAAEVRKWAKAQGIDLPERGRIPGGVQEQYEDAHRAVAS